MEHVMVFATLASKEFALTGQYAKQQNAQQGSIVIQQEETVKVLKAHLLYALLALQIKHLQHGF